MADKLKAVKITFNELEHIVEKKGGNKTFNQQKERINDKKKRTKRPEIGIYRPPSLLKQKQQAESGDGGSQAENWEEEIDDGQSSSATDSKENSVEREFNDKTSGARDHNASEKNDFSKFRRKRPEIQRYVPKGKILEMQQKENEDTESSGEVENSPLFLDEGSGASHGKFDLNSDDIKNIKVTISKDGDSKQVSVGKSRSGEVINSSDPVVASRSKSDTQITGRQQTYDRFRKQNSQDSTDSKGNYKDNKTTQGYANKDRFSQSPKPQRIERRRGKFQSDWNDSRHYTDDDLSDGGHVIQTMVFERQNKNQPESKLTVENMSQKPPKGNGKPGSKRYSLSTMRRPRAGSFSSDVSTASDLSIDEETTERILDWDKEVEMEMAKQVHNETQKLKEYLEKQGDNVDWDRDNKHSNWSDWAADVAQDDMQDMPPNWDNIKPAGSHDMLDKISSTKDNIDEGQKNYQNAGTFPRRNKRNLGPRERYKDSSLEGRNDNWNTGSWDRHWNKDHNRQDADDFHGNNRGYGRRERRYSDGSKGQRRRRQSRESNGRRSRDSSVSSVHSVRSNHGDDEMYGSYRRHKRQNSNSSLRGGSSRERLNDPESLNIKVTIGNDKRQVVLPDGNNKHQDKTVGRGRGRGRGRRQHGLDMDQGQTVGSRGQSEESENPDPHRKEYSNKGSFDKEESAVSKGVGRGRGSRHSNTEYDNWGRDHHKNKESDSWGRGDHHGKKESGSKGRGGHHGNKESDGWGRGGHRGNKESDGWGRDSHHGTRESDSWGRGGHHGNKDSDGWGRDGYHGNKESDGRGRGVHHGNKDSDGWGKGNRHGNRESEGRGRGSNYGERTTEGGRADNHGNRDTGSGRGGRSRNNSERDRESKSPRTEKTSPQTHSGGLIKLPSNVHTTEEHNKEENPSHVHKEKENTPNPTRDNVRDTRTGSGQRQLFDPKNPNKPIVVQNSSNLKFQDQGMESPSPPAFPQNPPFQGYGQFYGPQFPEQGVFPGPPIPPQMMPPHGYFFGYPPPQYYEMIRGKQREIMFEKMLNECMSLDSELGDLVARRLNGESLTVLANQRQELMKRYEHLILIDIDLSTKHNVDQLLWKAVFYQVIEVFRKHMSEEDDAKSRLTQILDEGTAFYESLLQKLQNNYHFKLEDFLDTHILPPENIHRMMKLALLSSQRNMICLGDIARYREQINDSGKVNYGRARNWYTKAQLLAPKNGRPYNQLAILALYTRRKLDAVYYYMRSLAASNPFLTARESLMSLFDEARKKAEAAEKKRSDERGTQKTTKPHPHKHKHGERIEIWIGADGTSREDHGEEPDVDDLEKMDAVELNKRFVLSFLNIHGKLFTKIGRESFPECCAQMLKEFRVLLKYSAIGPTRLLQLMAINMFAIDNTALKDTSLQSGFRSELQEQAVELGLDMFGILVERCTEQLKDHLKSSDYPTKLCNRELEELIPGVKIWTDWMICNSGYWNPPPSTLDPSLGVDVDVWNSTSGLCNILKDIDTSHVKLYSEKKEGCEPVLLMEDAMVSGFVPLLSAPIEISYVHKLVDKEIAQDCLRIQKLQLFGDYLCGIEPPMLAYSVEKKEYYSIALSVEESEEKHKPSLSGEEWSDDEDVIIESEEEIVHDDDDEHVKELKVKKHKLKQMKQEQEKHKENLQKIIDKNRHHCIELEIHPIFLVPDTNCFIEHLSGLKKLILSKKFTVTVPLIVINELDGLAKGSKDGQYSTPQHANKVRKTAEESVEFLEAEFDKKNSHLKTQTSKGNILETIAFRSEESESGTGNNDDIILSSCLHYCKDKAREFMPKEKDGPVRLYRDVVLLTDDRNLRLKAHTHNVPVKDVPSFMHWSKIT